MEHYVGLDVSLKLTAICIVNQTGRIEREGVVPSAPEANSQDPEQTLDVWPHLRFERL
jgi:predicted NBD/HSP70 family sugar kinase